MPVSFAFNCYGRMVENVKRSIFAVCSAVVVIAMVASIAVVTAGPATPTSKPFDWKKMCTKNPDLAWVPVCDLLNMIKNIPAGPPGPAGPAGATGPTGPAGTDGKDGAQGPAGTCNVEIKTGGAADMEVVTVPTGFSTDQCSIIVSPGYMYCPNYAYLNGFVVRYTAMDDHQSYKLYIGGLCYQNGDTTPYVVDGTGFYSIVCKS
jgi:hypothetical protein